MRLQNERQNLATGKVRIFELAKEVGLSSKELVTLFNERLGGVFEAKNQLSVVPDHIADLVRSVLLKPAKPATPSGGPPVATPPKSPAAKPSAAKPVAPAAKSKETPASKPQPPEEPIPTLKPVSPTSRRPAAGAPPAAKPPVARPAAASQTEPAAAAPAVTPVAPPKTPPAPAPVHKPAARTVQPGGGAPHRPATPS